MPYVSDKQRKFFHANKDKPGSGITSKMVEEYDKESKGKELPERANEKKSCLNIFGYLCGMLENLEKNAFDMSDVFKRNADTSTDSPDREKIKKFMQNETMDAIIAKVRSDYSLTEDEKNKIIKALIGLKQQSSGNTITGSGLAGGIGGLLLSLLAMSGTQLSTSAKLLIGSLMTGAGGLLGNLIGKGGLVESEQTMQNKINMRNI